MDQEMVIFVVQSYNSEHECVNTSKKLYEGFMDLKSILRLYIYIIYIVYIYNIYMGLSHNDKVYCDLNEYCFRQKRAIKV